MWKFLRFYALLVSVVAGLSWVGYHSRNAECAAGFRQGWLMGLAGTDSDLKASDLPQLPTLESKLTPEELKQYQRDKAARSDYFDGQGFAICVNICIAVLIIIIVVVTFAVTLE